MDYGKGIQHAAVLDIVCKAKSKWIARRQDDLLALFERLTRLPPADRIYSRVARRLVGAFLYSIKLEVNASCPLSCEMCYLEKRDLELPFAAIARFLNDIRGCNVRLEILGGEPLLREDLEQIICYAKKKAKVPFVSLYTNALLAGRTRAVRLKEAGLDAALVTLISHRADVHDRFTGKNGSWRQTTENIVHLREAGIKTYTFTAIHRKNFRDYREIYFFAKEKLGVDPLFYQYIPQKREDKLTIDSGCWHKIKHWILLEKNREHAEFVRTFYMLTGNACSGGNFVLTIKADGSVQPCPFLNDIPLGNILRQSIWVIYRRRFHSLRLREFKSLPPECSGCGYRSVCWGGCRAGNRMLFGGYAHRDFRCLGPYQGPVCKDRVIDCVPSFF